TAEPTISSRWSRSDNKRLPAKGEHIMHQENRKAGKGEGREQRPSAEMEKILGELFDVPSKARTPRQERPDVTGFEFPWRLVGRVVPGLAVAGGLCWIGWMLLVGIERLPLARD